MWELAYQLPQWIFMVLEIEPALYKCFRTPSTGVILSFT